MSTTAVSPRGTVIDHTITVARTRLEVAERSLDRALTAWNREHTDATAIDLDAAVLTLSFARAAFASPCVVDLWDECPMHGVVHHHDVPLLINAAEWF